ncbi:MAG: LacI family DNA-binding transcriptional regulator [Ruegeria sp.]|uniref:LacI family DNA-binding transcriptional regulator n=1 Tax=Ruegeria sp. TaxID=1879320 RepID=UPI00349E8C66
MDRRPTIKDVAKEAGVSKSTVSLVLQRSPLVKEKTRQQVREAMARIGYVYNRAAAQMRTANVGLIGLVINDLRNPFFTEFATSLQMALAGRGYATVVANTDEDPGIQAQVVGAMIEHGVSGLIVSPAYGEVSDAFDTIERAGIPAMQVLRKVDARTDRFPFAAPDYLEGSRIATQHLLKQGAQRIAFVGGLEGRDVTRERMVGYIEALDAVSMQPLLLTGKASRSFGREAAMRLASEYSDCDAALCFNDLVALGLLAGCHELQRSIGSDFRVVGFDDIEEASHSWPSLTSVHCDVAGFGQGVAQTMLTWLEDGSIPEKTHRTAVALRVRGSSADGD